MYKQLWFGALCAVLAMGLLAVPAAAQAADTGDDTAMTAQTDGQGQQALRRGAGLGPRDGTGPRINQDGRGARDGQGRGVMGRGAGMGPRDGTGPRINQDGRGARDGRGRGVMGRGAGMGPRDGTGPGYRQDAGGPRDGRGRGPQDGRGANPNCPLNN